MTEEEKGVAKKERMASEFVPPKEFGEWLGSKILRLANEYGLDVNRLVFVHDNKISPYWINVFYKDLGAGSGSVKPLPFYGQFITGPDDWHDVSEPKRPKTEATLRTIFDRIRKSQKGTTAPVPPLLADQRVVDLLEKILGKLDEISAKLGEKRE